MVSSGNHVTDHPHANIYHLGVPTVRIEQVLVSGRHGGVGIDVEEIAQKCDQGLLTRRAGVDQPP